jgi:hypothetical protein
VLAFHATFDSAHRQRQPVPPVSDYLSAKYDDARAFEGAHQFADTVAPIDRLPIGSGRCEIGGETISRETITLKE